MKVSFIATIFNEEETVGKLLESLSIQTRLPDEIVIVDGGSSDRTFNIASNFVFSIPKKCVKIFKKAGNRSVGRNAAIKMSTGDIIVCSDAGCVLDRNWLKNLVKPFDDKRVNVVAGYYKGLSESAFQKCLIPYVLVMEDKVDSDTFLPSARSMAFRKSVWENLGGFPESFSDNEDYVFAKQMHKAKFKIQFAQDAVVYWMPRKDLAESFYMFYRFARGDAASKIYRPKVVLVFVRYITGALLMFWNIHLLLILLIIYVFWAIKKNYKYVDDLRAVYILPMLQVISDIAVIAGTSAGLIKYGS